MRSFNLVNPTKIADASAALKANAYVLSGGTDLLDVMKDEVLETYPATVVNLHNIPNMSYITESGGVLKIGAMTVLEDIAKSTVVQNNYTALAQAASRTASPHLREMGTIGGNISQMVRCWFFRNPDNHFDCIRKGGKLCYAVAGDNRYHSIFGALKGCFAVNPSDTAPALVALNASIVTNQRTIPAEQFWTVSIPGSTTLNAGEIVTEIDVPTPASGVKSAFMKFAIRKSIDFPVVNCASAIGGGSARICLNAVYNTPYRATDAETSIAGKTITVDSADAAGAAGVAKAVALPYNSYKIQIAKTLIKRTILATAGLYNVSSIYTDTV